MASIHLTTPIPGPNSQALAHRRAAAVPRGLSCSTSIFVREAEGAVLTDVDGNRFLDLAGGIGCINVGHRNSAVVAAVRRQLDEYLHLSMQVTGYEGYVAVAEKLNQLTPGTSPRKTLLANSGAEAVENAVKIARSYTGRAAILCFEDGFHGRTMLGLTLTSRTQPYKQGFGPFLPEVYRLKLASCSSAPRSTADHIRFFEESFRRNVQADEIAAVILEPILGEGGFIVPSQQFLEALQHVCKKYGILLIVDEIQSGFGRTGELFASTHFGLEPDLFLTAKSLGGGLPIAAVTGRADIMDHPQVGGLGGTFSGNPLACAAALAVFEAFEDGTLLQRARDLGQIFRERALAWKKSYPVIGEIRGIAAMQAIELVHPGPSAEPNPAAAKHIKTYALDHGVVTILAGVNDNVLRFLMPLVMTDVQLTEALNVIEDALEGVPVSA